MQGQIVKILSNDYFVLADNTTYICKSRGKFRNDNITPLVGDYVFFDATKNYIMEVLPRNNYLIRPSVANVDQALVVTSLKKPELDLVLLDKFLVVLEFNRIKPIICFTKKDLLTREEYRHYKPIIKYYKKIGYTVLFNNNVSRIKKIFKNNTTVFTGQTGSGKSTLINRINPKLNFQTGEISEALGRGKHTTRHVELVNMNKGKILDTPGFSDIDLNLIKDIDKYFVEFQNYPCNFKNCKHINEQECEIKKQVKLGNILNSRYNNYKKFVGSR